MLFHLLEALALLRIRNAGYEFKIYSHSECMITTTREEKVIIVRFQNDGNQISV